MTYGEFGRQIGISALGHKDGYIKLVLIPWAWDLCSGDKPQNESCTAVALVAEIENTR
jgi:hypothetical protein